MFEVMVRKAKLKTGVNDSKATNTSSTDERHLLKLLVKREIFLIDANWLSKSSPIFAKVLSNSNVKDYVLEIVDEKDSDIAVFFECAKEASSINGGNFRILIRLATKYQLKSLLDACEEYVQRNCDERNMTASEALSILLAQCEYNVLKDETSEKLIVRIAQENIKSIQQMGISRLLSPKLYISILAANLNLTKVNEMQMMNKHVFNQIRNRTQYKRAKCGKCKILVDTVYCRGCKLYLCEQHWKGIQCPSDLAEQMLIKFNSSIANIEWE